MNPNLNDVLNKKIKLFENAFVITQYLQRYNALVIDIESYEKALTLKDIRKIRQLIQKYKPRLKKMFGADYIEINDYSNVT